MYAAFTAQIPVTHEDADYFARLYHHWVSPWLRIKEYKQDSVEFYYDRPYEDGEGDFKGHWELSYIKIVEAIGKAIEKEPQALCCMEALLSGDIGTACSQDFDIVMQIALFDELVYG